MKVVKNACYGGFGLSNEAIQILYLIGSDVLKELPIEKYFSSVEEQDPPDTPEEYRRLIENESLRGLGKMEEIGNNVLQNEWIGTIHDLEAGTTFHFVGHDFDAGEVDYSVRSHPDLVSLVEDLGGRANGDYADLVVKEVPDEMSFTITEYDGVETIRERDTKPFSCRGSVTSA